MTTNTTGQEALIERLRDLSTKQPGYGMSYHARGPNLSGNAEIHLFGKRAEAAHWLMQNAPAVIEALFSTPGPTRLREGLRDQIKSILNSHAFESFRIAGAAAFIPQHPGPAADAILSLLSSSPNKGEG